MMSKTKQLSNEVFVAVQIGNAVELKELLAAGANVNAKDMIDRTPLHWAAIYGYTERTKILLKAGAKVNAKNKIGWTPLHLAAWRGYTEVVKILLKAGADVNAMDKDGLTPLQMADYYPEVVEVLKVAEQEAAG